MVANAALAGVGVALAGGHPISILVGAVASPFTSLNPALAAGWFAGYTQYKMQKPTGLDAKEFLVVEDVRSLWGNRVGRILLVTAFGNLGSSLGISRRCDTRFGTRARLVGQPRFPVESRPAPFMDVVESHFGHNLKTCHGSCQRGGFLRISPYLTRTILRPGR